MKIKIKNEAKQQKNNWNWNWNEQQSVWWAHTIMKYCDNSFQRFVLCLIEAVHRNETV